MRRLPARRDVALLLHLVVLAVLAPLTASAQQNTAVRAGDAANGSPIGLRQSWWRTPPLASDGRQSSLTGFGAQRGLDSVSAANIEIEIINNPSARFDAAGMAGIINIIYKKEQQLGWSGDIGFGLGVGQFTKQRRDLPTDLGSFSNNEKVIPSVNLNYRTPRTSAHRRPALRRSALPNSTFVSATCSGHLYNEPM